jgi:hypothetical protein
MQFKASHIAPLVAIGATALAIAAAPLASAATSVSGTTGSSNSGNAQITAAPGSAAQEAAQLQQPFGGYSGALLFHHR